MAKLTSLLIGFIVFSVIIALFLNFEGQAAVSFNTTFANDTYSTYNQLQELNSKTIDIKESTVNVEAGQTGVLDVLGGFFNDAYRTLLLLTTGFDIFDTMFNQALNDANIGVNGNILRTGITAILLLVIFGIVLSTLLKREI